MENLSQRILSIEILFLQKMRILFTNTCNALSYEQNKQENYLFPLPLPLPRPLPLLAGVLGASTSSSSTSSILRLAAVDRLDCLPAGVGVSSPVS